MTDHRMVRHPDGTGKLIFGLAFTALGGALLVQRVTGHHVLDYVWQLWPVLLIIMGIKVLVDHYAHSASARARDVFLATLIIIFGLSVTASHRLADADWCTAIREAIRDINSVEPWSPAPLANVVAHVPIRWRAQADPQPRGLNDRWYAPDYDDSTWPTVSTERMWMSQEGPLKGLSGTQAWGRVRFRIDPKWRGRHIVLHIPSIDEQATVYFNGEQVTAAGAISPLHLDLTHRLRFDRPNVLAVRVYASGTLGGVYEPVTVYAVPRHP